MNNHKDTKLDAKYPSVTNIEETPPASRRFLVGNEEDDEDTDFAYGNALDKQDPSTSFQ